MKTIMLITGKQGSGKSTLAQKFEKSKVYERYDFGNLKKLLDKIKSDTGDHLAYTTDNYIVTLQQRDFTTEVSVQALAKKLGYQFLKIKMMGNAN